MPQTILVTGGGRGIGRGICLQLAKQGYSVVINYAGNRDSAEETKQMCQNKAIDVLQVFVLAQADISTVEGRASLVEQTFSATGTLDGLVNNAGVAPKERADLLDMSEESYDRLLDTNLKGPVLLSQAIARQWRDIEELEDKTIIFITSVSATMVSTNRAEYCISKAGLAMAASLFAARLAGDGARVYEIRPGIIKTDRTSAVEAKYDAMLEEGLVPQKRWGEPKDIGKAVCSLLNEELPFSTGAVITVDGGLSISRL